MQKKWALLEADLGALLGNGIAIQVCLLSLEEVASLDLEMDAAEPPHGQYHLATLASCCNLAIIDLLITQPPVSYGNE